MLELIVAAGALACVLAGTAISLWQARRRGVGFREWVKTPSLRHEADAFFKARAELDVSDLDDDDVRELVLQLWERNPEDPFCEDKLRLLGNRAAPCLLEQLRDPRLARVTFSDEDGAYLSESPFERICDALRASLPRAAIPLLLPFVEHEQDHFRKHAGMLLGEIGFDDCAAPIERLLADDDEYVRSHTQIGIERGLELDRCTEGFQRAVFAPLRALLERGAPGGSHKAAWLLLQLDRERAATILLSERVLTPSNPELEAVLEACNRAALPIPHAQLLPLLAVLSTLADANGEDSGQRWAELADALEAYARNPDDETERHLRQRLSAHDPYVRAAAAAGLVRLARIESPLPFARARGKQAGFAALSKPQQHVLAAYAYDAEVCNGGHAQYFTNSSGNRWPTALDALEALGAKQRAAVLRDACALFPDNHPPTERDPRCALVAGFSTSADQALDALDKRYYAAESEQIELLISLYALEHPDDFRER